MKAKRIAIRIVLVAFLVFLACGLDCRLKVRHYWLTSEKITSPLRILLITDLHSCNYGKSEKKLTEKIDKFNPDLILLGGDIYDDDLPMDITTEFLNIIGPKYKCFYTIGNHEIWSGKADSIKNLINQSGVRILDGEKLTLKVHEDSINVCGWPDVTENIVWNVVLNGVDSLARDCDTSKYTLLLYHRPEMVETFMKSPFDLIMAGHYHGGQFRLPWMREGIYAPDHAGELKYTGGVYPFGNRFVVISRGLARESTLIPRFYIRPEIVEITVLPLFKEK